MRRLLEFRGRLAGERGYTLTEMLVVLLILGVVTTALMQVFVSATNAEVSMQRRFQAQVTGRVALDKFRREVHCANLASPAGATTSITLTLPTYCRAGSGPITWCTRIVSTDRYALYRIPGSSCSGGVKWADYLTLDQVFNYTAPVAGSSLGKVAVDLRVNVNPKKSVEAYELKDEIVMRNTSR
jgi:prepilin-type N-terminal cleavage/methylation domain-containing protein